MMSELGVWCEQQLGARPAETLFEAGYLSRVTGLRLADGRNVVLKIRQPAERLEACMRVQRHLWQEHYPCAEPLAGPAVLGDQVATAEAYLPGGTKQPESPGKLPELAARALAELVRNAPAPDAIGTLDPPPAWFCFGRTEAGLWPAQQMLPDGRTARDLNTFSGPWLDHAARRARARLNACTLPLAIGHCDWYTENLRWQRDRLYAVHNWDSVVRAPEGAIVGAAATAFAETPAVPAATVEQSQEFMEVYGRRWSNEEREVAWATGLWLLAFNAKVEAARGQRDRTIPLIRRELEVRLRLAGA
ncbi:MAG: hypothetical protein KGJ86_11860 [Chloroflexota bacterium]|nr:hypothetical protein [Chloroflexota bacterium]